MINKVILIGNVGSDPDVRTLSSGAKVAKIQVATSEKFKDKATNSTTTRTEWHNIILWRNLAEWAEKYIRKGAQIYIDGSIHYRKYTDQSGVEKYATDITANDFKLLGRKADNQASQTAPAPTPAPSQGQQYVPTPAYGNSTQQGNQAATASQVANPAPMPEDVDDLPF